MCFCILHLYSINMYFVSKHKICSVLSFSLLLFYFQQNGHLPVVMAFPFKFIHVPVVEKKARSKDSLKMRVCTTQ